MKRTIITEDPNKKMKENIDINVFYIRELYESNNILKYPLFPNEISNIMLRNNYKQICGKYKELKDINARINTCYKIISKLDIELQNNGWQVIFDFTGKDTYYYHNSKTNETRKIHWSYINYY